MNKYIKINFLKLFDKEKNVTSIHKVLYINNENHLVTLDESNDKKVEKNGVSLTNYYALNNELFILKKIDTENGLLHYLIVKVDTSNQQHVILLKEFTYEMASTEYFYKYENDIVPFIKSLDIVEVRDEEKTEEYVMQLNEEDIYQRIFSSILYSIEKTNSYEGKYKCKELLEIIEKEIPKTLLYNRIKKEIQLDANEFINNKAIIHVKRKKQGNIDEIIKFKDDYFEKTLKLSLENNFLFMIYKYYCIKHNLSTNHGLIKLIKLSVQEVVSLLKELYDNFYYT